MDKNKLCIFLCSALTSGLQGQAATFLQQMILKPFQPTQSTSQLKNPITLCNICANQTWLGPTKPFAVIYTLLLSYFHFHYNRFPSFVTPRETLVLNGKLEQMNIWYILKEKNIDCNCETYQQKRTEPYDYLGTL